MSLIVVKMMFSLILLFTLFQGIESLITSKVSFTGKTIKRFHTSILAVEDDANTEPPLDLKNAVLKRIGAFKGPLGFYALMLAPIYGIGLPGPFGSMTDFSTLQNRGPPTQIANEYILGLLYVEISDIYERVHIYTRVYICLYTYTHK
jgi:hypothetical protein